MESFASGEVINESFRQEKRKITRNAIVIERNFIGIKNKLRV
jgi:hypothetical protein